MRSIGNGTRQRVVPRFQQVAILSRARTLWTQSSWAASRPPSAGSACALPSPTRGPGSETTKGEKSGQKKQPFESFFPLRCIDQGVGGTSTMIRGGLPEVVGGKVG